MEYIALEKFILASGAALIGSEIVCNIIKKIQDKPSKLATGEIKGKKELKGLTGDKGIMISKEIMLAQKTSFEGLCILGPTGSGKTTSYFFPNLLENNLRGSIIVTDPKGELFESTSHYQEKVCGRKVIKFSPLEPNNSYRYNILENCKTTTEVTQLAALLLINGALSIELMTGKKTGGIEWLQMSEPLLSAAMLYCWHLGSGMNTIENAFNMLINKNPRELDILLKNCGHKDVMQQYNIFKSVSGSDRTIGSIKITLATNMKLFCDPDVNKVNSSTDFTAESLREKETIIYITYPERKSSYIAPYIAPFFSQFIDKLLDSYNEDSLPVTLLFDEFANIGMLNNLSVNLATVRSRKLSFNVCLQSISQIEQIYGKDNTLAILNNLKTKIVLPGLNDTRTLQYISELCGKTEITTTNKTKAENKTSKTISSSTKDLLSVDELRRLEKDSELILMHNRQPVLDKQNIFYTQKKYSQNIKKVSKDINIKHKPIVNKFDAYIDKIIEDFRSLEEETESNNRRSIIGELFSR